MTRFRRAGFTLIELMVVAAVLGILATIALPKFGNMIIKAKEAAVRGKLGALRSAISIYYSDTEGQMPYPVLGTIHTTFDYGDSQFIPIRVLSPKYIDKVPVISIPWDSWGNHARPHWAAESDSTIDSFNPPLWGTDTMWIYGANIYFCSHYFIPTGKTSIFINTHTRDTGGRVWSTW